MAMIPSLDLFAAGDLLARLLLVVLPSRISKRIYENASPVTVYVLRDGSTRRYIISSAKNVTTVHVYGASVTLGTCHGRARACGPYGDLLGDYLGDRVSVEIFGINAAGPEHWLMCGIEAADVIVSEYRLTERREGVLDEWYALARNSSRHLAVLDLWTWLDPPPRRPSLTSRVADKHAAEDPDGVSYMSLDGFAGSWRERIPQYYDGYMFNEIAASCFDAALEKSQVETNEVERCRQKHTGNMQHATQGYHEAVAEQLARHLEKVVFPKLDLDSTTKTEGKDTGRRGGMCVGEWGVGLSYLYSSGWNESEVVRQNSGFSIGSPLSGRTDKKTLNSNSTGARLTLACPPPYSKARVGYVGHTNTDETGSFKLNDVSIDTTIKNRHDENLRLAEFSPEVTSPVTVVVERLAGGAYIELTGLACQ